MSTLNLHSEITDFELAARLKRGDREVAALLYDRYARPLFGIAFRLVRSEKIAEDVLQEGFARCWERIDQFDPARGTFFTWLHGIIRNLALDTIKSKAYGASAEIRGGREVVDGSEGETSETYNPETIGVRESVEKLEPDLRIVVDALYFRGCTQSEAARELDLPLGTVKTRVRRAVSLLREMLKDDIE